MKTSKLILTALLIIVSSIIGFNQLYSQSANNCIPNRIPSQWISQTHFVEGPNRGLIGSVQYEARIVGLNVEASIDWSTLIYPSDGLSIESVKAILEYDLALSLSGCNNASSSAFTTTVSFYYKTDCSYDKYSIMWLKHGNAGICCDDPEKNFEHLLYNSEWFQIHKTKENCGTFKCCKKVYTINCTLVGGVYKAVFDPTIAKFTITDCATPSGLPNCNDIEHDPPLPPMPPPNCTGNCD